MQKIIISFSGNNSEKVINRIMGTREEKREENPEVLTSGFYSEMKDRMIRLNKNYLKYGIYPRKNYAG